MISAADVNTAIVNRWGAGSLDTVVTGGIQAGRLPATITDTETARTMPYAWLDTKKVSGDVFESNSKYIAAFMATIAIYGVGQQAVDVLGKDAAAVLGLSDWTIPGVGNYLVSAFYSPESGSLEQAPEQREGEDVWLFRLVFDVLIGGPE
jgi:hypothetical protein